MSKDQLDDVIFENIRQNRKRLGQIIDPDLSMLEAEISEYTWTTEKELSVKPGGSFRIATPEGDTRLYVHERTFSTAKRYPAGTVLWAKAGKTAKGNRRLLQLMEAELHTRLLSEMEECKLDRELDRFAGCPETMRCEILRRRFARKGEVPDIRPPEIDSDYFFLTYHLSKEGYSLEQRDRIEHLLPKGDLPARGKNEMQLDYILNISEEYDKAPLREYEEIMAVLDKRIYGQQEAKRRIAAILAHRSFMDDRGVKILLVGGEGSGKSRFWEVICDLVKLPSAVIELGGETNPCALIGHHSTYADADAGDILRIFRKLRTTEAVIGWRDIDKMGESREGIAINALKGIFSENCHVDKFNLYPLSTRHTVHIAEATTDRDLPGFVKAAFEIIRLDPYSEDDKVAIAREHTVPELYQKVWMGDVLAQRQPEEAALRFIARNFSGGEGMKEMEACCAAVVKRMSLDELTGHSIPFDEKTVRLTLGDSPDWTDPMIRYNLARGRYTPEIENEIRATRDLLKNQKLTPEERTKEENRLGYLVDMCEAVPPKTRFDRDEFLKGLNESHYGLDQVKETLADYFGSQAARGGSLAGMRVLLEGPPGGGKSSLVASVAKTLNAAYVRVPLNNVSEVGTLKGLYKTYASADSGMIVKGISQAKRRTPDAAYYIVHLDEVDKLSREYTEILIDLLDDSCLFLDYFLGVPVKLSNILFFGTANDVSRIPAVILDRFRMIHMDGYTGEEKAHILQEYILPSKEREYAASKLALHMGKQAQELLLNRYCHCAGVRDLKKAVDRVVEHAVSHRGKRTKLELDAPMLQKVLGEAPMADGNLPSQWLPGCAKALSVSEGGAGSCSAVEAVVLPGTAGLTVTGLAGESSQESVKIAVTYLKSRFACAQGPMDIHFSFGQGGIHKDGPSAGVAEVVALLSAMSKRCSDPDAAYTGEIDLLGNVYPVGGVGRKIQAAERAGCTRVFVPAENVRRLTAQERAAVSIEIVPVTHVEEVIQTVFERSEQL